MSKYKFLITVLIISISSCDLTNRGLVKLKKNSIGINQIEIVDINNDNRKDIIFGNAITGELNCLLNVNEFEFEEVALVPLKLKSSIIKNYDINNDKLIDLILATDVGPVILEQTNELEYNTHFLDTTLTLSSTLRLADLDNDGDMDIIAGSEVKNQLKFYENLGGMQFNIHIISDSLQNIYALEVGDINNDGKIDIVCGSMKMQNVFAFINLGNLLFSKRVLCNNAKSECIAIDDMNGDGNVDLICASEVTNSIHVHDDSSNWISYTNIVDLHGAEVHSMITTDIDLNGEVDIIYSSFSPPKLSENSHSSAIFKLLQINGEYFKDSNDIFTSYVYNITQNDIDNDGDKDLIYSCMFQGELTLIRNNDIHHYSISSLQNRFEKLSMSNYYWLYLCIIAIILLLFFLRMTSYFKSKVHTQLSRIDKLQRSQEIKSTYTLKNNSDEGNEAKDKWTQYYDKNKEINPDFISKLQEMKMTTSDIRLCTLIRSQMNNHEIAELLSINVKSVYMKRQRISKKMNIKSSNDLDEYLNSL